MPYQRTPTADGIRQAVRQLRQLRPAYREILTFFEQVTIAQAESKHRIAPDAVKLDQAHLGVKMKNGFPLVSPDRFVIDSEASGALLARLCAIAQRSNPTMAKSAQRVTKALQDDAITIDLLFRDLVSDASVPMAKASQDLAAESNVLAFLIHNSALPSLQRCVEQILAQIPKEGKWLPKGVCPLCGSTPWMALLDEKGQRRLSCRFCRYEWTVPRVFCPFCENEEQKSMQYFFSDEEPEYQVDTCDRCNAYLKTLDTREPDRILCLALEDAATLHLDVTAREKGFVQTTERL